MEHIIIDNILDENNLSISIEKMPNTETRCRIKLDNNSLCNVTQSGKDSSWQNAHFHKHCKELYLVQKGKILLITKENNIINYNIIKEGNIVILEPAISHNIYMYKDTVTCVLKYGDIKENDWYCDEKLDKLSKNFDCEDIISNFNIYQYNDECKNDIIQFLKEVAIVEFKYNEWEDYFNSNNKFWFVTNQENHIIATIAALKISEKEIKLNNWYVKNEYRHIGIGKKLYELFLQYVLDNNYKTIKLHIYSKFDKAIKFCEREGYILYENEDDEDGGLSYIKKI